jgi:hypothetical protein
VVGEVSEGGAAEAATKAPLNGVAGGEWLVGGGLEDEGIGVAEVAGDPGEGFLDVGLVGG